MNIPKKYLDDTTLKIVDGKVYVQHLDELGTPLFAYEFGKLVGPVMKDVTPVCQPVGVDPEPMPDPPLLSPEELLEEVKAARDFSKVAASLYERWFEPPTKEELDRALGLIEEQINVNVSAGRCVRMGKVSELSWVALQEVDKHGQPKPFAVPEGPVPVDSFKSEQRLVLCGRVDGDVFQILPGHWLKVLAIVEYL